MPDEITEPVQHHVGAQTFLENVTAPVDCMRCPMGCHLNVSPIDGARRGTCELMGVTNGGRGVLSMGWLAMVCTPARDLATSKRAMLANDDMTALMPPRREAPILHPERKPALAPVFANAPASLMDWALYAEDLHHGEEQEALRAHARELVKLYGTAAAQPWLVLVGDTGTGKTLLMRIMGRLAAEAGLSVVYTRFTEMVQRVKATRAHDASEREEAVLARYTTPALLILDDIRPVFNSQDDENIAHHVISTRHAEDLGDDRRATYVATNLSVRELTGVIGVPAVSRLTDGISPRFCLWPPHRQMAE